MNATQTLNDLACEMELAGHAPHAMMASAGATFSLQSMLAKARAFRDSLAALRAAGVDDGSILGKLGEILATIIKYLPDIARIIAEVLALFGVPAPTP